MFPFWGGKDIILKISSKHVSCEFDKFRVDTHLCKLRVTPHFKGVFSRVATRRELYLGTYPRGLFGTYQVWLGR